jgi:predicted ABC-type sugar transport system permease subunit
MLKMVFSFDFTFTSSTFIFKVLAQFLIRILVDIRLTVHLRAHVLYKEVDVCVCVCVCVRVCVRVCVCVRISWVLIRIPTSLKSCYMKGLLNGTLT